MLSHSYDDILTYSHPYLDAHIHTYTHILTYLHTLILAYSHPYLDAYILSYTLTYSHPYIHTLISLNTCILTYSKTHKLTLLLIKTCIHSYENCRTDSPTLLHCSKITTYIRLCLTFESEALRSNAILSFVICNAFIFSPVLNNF